MRKGQKQQTTPQETGIDHSSGGLGLVQLTMLSIGATLASGVFSLSGDFAASGAHTLAVLLGWAICGVGMLALTMCFFRLSFVRPDLTSGLYSYAREGFGQYVGFNAAWGYWISAVLGNLSFLTLLFSSLGHFFPAFGDGTNGLSILCASVMIWAFALLVFRGVSEAIAINTLVVIAKIIPILVMVVAILLSGAFRWEIFTENFAGSPGGPSLLTQVKSTTYTTVWIFIGIEGAVVISGRAKTTATAGRATILAFLSLLVLYVLISVLSMGVMPTEALAALPNPPMAALLASVVGPWGAALVNIGVIISLGGALFTYTILCVDSIYQPALQHCFPTGYTRLNQKGAPVGGILLTTLVTQFFLILIYFHDATYQVCYALSTSAIMFPYALSAFFCLMVTLQSCRGKSRPSAFVWLYALVGSAYGLWMLYASGISNILISAILYFPGFVLYQQARRQQGEKLFPSATDRIVFTVLLIVALFSLWQILRGEIRLL